MYRAVRIRRWPRASGRASVRYSPVRMRVVKPRASNALRSTSKIGMPVPVPVKSCKRRHRCGRSPADRCLCHREAAVDAGVIGWARLPGKLVSDAFEHVNAHGAKPTFPWNSMSSRTSRQPVRPALPAKRLRHPEATRVLSILLSIRCRKPRQAVKGPRADRARCQRFTGIMPDLRFPSIRLISVRSVVQLYQGP
jgi:hypothetical protein